MIDMNALTRRQWMITKMMESGVSWYLAVEAVSSTAIEHPEWNMDEIKSLNEWEADWVS